MGLALSFALCLMADLILWSKVSAYSSADDIKEYKCQTRIPLTALLSRRYWCPASSRENIAYWVAAVCLVLSFHLGQIHSSPLRELQIIHCLAFWFLYLYFDQLFYCSFGNYESILRDRQALNWLQNACFYWIGNRGSGSRTPAPHFSCPCTCSPAPPARRSVRTPSPRGLQKYSDYCTIYWIGPYHRMTSLATLCRRGRRHRYFVLPKENKRRWRAGPSATAHQYSASA